MKNLFIFLTFIICLSCKAQQPQGTDLLQHLTPFVGTWEYQNSNEIFRVFIWEDNRYLKGHVEKVEVNTDGNGNTTETVIYKSEWCVQDPEFCIRHIIFGGSNDGNKMGGSIADNTINAEQGDESRDKKWGHMSLNIQQNNCTNCPIIAEWKVEAHTGIKLNTEPENFNVPTDLILTKVE